MHIPATSSITTREGVFPHIFETIVDDQMPSKVIKNVTMTAVTGLNQKPRQGTSKCNRRQQLLPRLFCQYILCPDLWKLAYEKAL